MSSMELVYVGPSEPSRSERRAERARKRQNRILIGIGTVCATAVFIVVFMAAMKVNKPTPEAGASETIPATTSSSIAPEWGTSTTLPTPETLATIVAPQWLQLAVAVPGWNGLGKLVTDGQPGHCERILPGELGRSVIAVAVDPTNAGTINVSDGKVTKEWRVIVQPAHTVAANDLASLCDVHPTVPTVVLVSSIPGDARPYVEARQAQP